MPKSVAISTLSLSKRGNVVSFHPVNLPPSIIAAGNYGARKSVSTPVLTIGKRPNVTAIFYDLFITLITQSNCPPAPKVPLVGQRYPNYYS